jgi:hypothetical protein
MSIRRGILKAFDSGTYTATVAITGSLGTWLLGVPVSRGIASGELTAGRSVAVLFFDLGNPKDCVVTAVWT